MPELPEVETIARGLAKRVVGDVIESVWLGSKPEPLKSSAQEIANTLEGARIASVRRVGKHIVFDLERSRTSAKPRPNSKVARATSRQKTSRAENPKARSTHSRSTHGRAEAGSAETANWIVHLGMTGHLLVCPADAELAKHTHAVAKLASGRELRFVDPRRFGRLSVVRSQNGFEAGGLEPLDVSFDAFVPLFRKRQTPMKSALLNQKLLRGVGNIYADESLFRAGIRPRRRAATLSREKLRLLYKSVQQVLQEAIAAGGSSISDYVGAEGEPGLFQMQHRVYGREGEPCLTCGTPIKRIVIAGRSSHYCPQCQK